MHTFIFPNPWALGDTVCLSALVRDIQRAYPGQYNVLMSRHFESYWENNPHCRYAKKGDKGQILQLEYREGIHVANSRGAKKHFLSWFHHDFKKKTGINVPVTEPRGEIYLTPEEQKPKYPGRYWVIVAGGKLDMTVKVWLTERYQAVVDELQNRGINCIQAGADFNKHFHPRLKNCLCAIGKTDSIRQLFSLIQNADGVICGITSYMHIAAALQKPCVVIAGGREAPWWEGYVNAYYPTAFGPTCKPVAVEHRYLHTIGLLDCGVGNMDKGCWKDRTVPIEQVDHTNQRSIQQLCRKPLRFAAQAVPECMNMIETDHVVEAVMSYYEDGTVPPIKGKAVQPPVCTEALTSLVKQTALKAILHAFVPNEVPVNPPERPALKILDHPLIGGQFTAFVLCYGDHLDIAKRCIDSILDNSSPLRVKLRVVANQPSRRLEDYLRAFHSDTITLLDIDHDKRRKYPAMRKLFWDKQKPIETKFILWFDDDSHVVDPNWLVLLANEIIANHPHGVRMYGCKYLHDLMSYKRAGFSPEKWFKAASWWKNQNLLLRDGRREASNGSVIAFASGGFWCLATDAMRAANIPDERLNHNGGDITIGEQVHQAGFKVKDFCRGKKPVCWSDAPRRGYREDFPWSKIT